MTSKVTVQGDMTNRSDDQSSNQNQSINQNMKSISDRTNCDELETNSNSATSKSPTATNISPGKKNKRKMAEPRRRVTDFSIRNICSESTSCSSFASEIESETFIEKRSRMEESGQDRSGYILPSKESKSQSDVAPLDVLVSLSLLTQHHNHHHQLQQLTHLNPSALQDIPGLVVPPRDISEERQSKRKSTKARSTENYRSDDNDDGRNVNNEDISNDFSIRFKSRHGDKSKIPEKSESARSSKSSPGDKKILSDEFLIKFKREQESESANAEVSADLISKQGGDTIFIDPPSNISNKNAETSAQNLLRDDKTINNSNSGVQQRKNYKNMTKQRRIEANARERTRVHTISAAFESLRKAVPSYSHNQRLSKLAILRIACSYILALVKLAELEDYDVTELSSRSSPDSMTFSQCVDLCTQTIQSEGKTKRRH